MKIHAVMIDETGCEFGVEVYADSKDEAIRILGSIFPESYVDQIKTMADIRKREADIAAEIRSEGDWDDLDFNYDD